MGITSALSFFTIFSWFADFSSIYNIGGIWTFTTSFQLQCEGWNTISSNGRMQVMRFSVQNHEHIFFSYLLIMISSFWFGSKSKMKKCWEWHGNNWHVESIYWLFQPQSKIVPNSDWLYLVQQQNSMHFASVHQMCYSNLQQWCNGVS